MHIGLYQSVKKENTYLNYTVQGYALWPFKDTFQIKFRSPILTIITSDCLLP